MSIGLKGNNDGSGAVQVGGSDAISISTGLVVTGAAGNLMLQSGTAVASTSGTSIDFTGIPSWAKRVTVMFNGVSTNGTSVPQVQIGAGSVDVSSYQAGTGNVSTTINTTRGVTLTSGVPLQFSWNAAETIYGSLIITLLGNNTWTFNGCLFAPNVPGTSFIGGAKTLAGTLDRVRITTVNGTDTFDAGSINILWE